MNIKIIDKRIKRIESYMLSADINSQFGNACSIALEALYDVKILIGKLNKETPNQPKSTNIKVILYIPVDKKTDFWYARLNGMVYNVKECTYGDFKDCEGLHNKEPKDCYIIIDGASETNIILKEDCKLIENKFA